MMNQTIDTVYVIIQLLKMIDEDETIDVKEKHPLIDAVIYLADEHLTGNENFKNIVTIREAGFDVYAGEQDRFGWLVGCIELKRGGVIMFG
jgi:dynactin complex subunit